MIILRVTADAALRRLGNKVGNTPTISSSSCPRSNTQSMLTGS
jgi:hypothetical protein